MRKDLNKQLCEHERHGSDRKFREVRRSKAFDIQDEDGPVGGRESMTKRHNVGWRNKEFAENFAPLWGVIRKNANRPWDKVYGELCEVFDRRSVINQHILTHLFDFVETKTYLNDDGEVWVRPSYGHPHALGGSSEYYVHPKTGLLLKNPKYRNWRVAQKEKAAKKAAEALKTHRVIDDKMELFCINDVWFIAEMKPCPNEYTSEQVKYGAYHKPHQTYLKKTYTPCYDVIKEGYVCFPTPKYAASKKTASHKELKKYGIVK